MTSSVEELITSSFPVAWGSTHSPPMKTLSRAWSSAAVAICLLLGGRRRRLAARPTLAGRERRGVLAACRQAGAVDCAGVAGIEHLAALLADAAVADPSAALL